MTRKAMQRVAWLLLVPFLLFSTMSQGTMLAADAHRGVHVVICTGTGMVEMVMSADGHLHPADEEESGDHEAAAPCAWALHGQSSLAELAAPPGLPQAIELEAHYSPDLPLHAIRADVLTPAARGPPLV